MLRLAMALGAATTFACLGGCATIHGAVGATRGWLAPPVPGPRPVTAAEATALGDEQIDRRLAFLTQRLDTSRRHATFWYYGFLAENAGGMAASAATAPGAKGSARDFAIIEASKAFIGTVYLLAAPLPGRRGADPIREMPSASHEERAAQLVQAEALLYAAGLRAEERTGWRLHVGNVVVNGAGATALMAEGSYGKAALSFFPDVAIGEAEILLAPWKPATDWQEYEEFVAHGSLPPVPRTQWHLRGFGRGLALQLDF